MSLPNHNREMLLSAALDGALSAQEQADFDREIATDASFAREFDELQRMRADLHSCFAGLRTQKLPAGSADRIVAAAMAETQRNGQNRPAIFQDQPGRFNHSSSTKWIAAVLTLAASLMVAVTLWNRDDTPVASKNSIATLDKDHVRAPVDNVEPALVEDSQRQPAALDFEAIAANQSKIAEETEMAQATRLQDLASQDPAAVPKVMGIKPSPADQIDSNQVASSAASIESSQAAMSGPEMDRQPLNVVMVLSIELTSVGRDQLALQEALRSTEIRLDGGSVMGDEVVSHLQNANVIDSDGTESGNSAKLFFIEASAKRIDRLVNHLMSNPDSFASIGLGLAMEPPLLAAVGELRDFDPTKIRQGSNVGIARDIVTRDRRSLSIAPEYPFVPLSSDIVDSGILQSSLAPQPSINADPSANAVDDFPSQLLLLVK